MIKKKVESFLDRHGVELKNRKIAVAVSGGPDSLALLHYLWSSREKLKLELLALHVDHMFRGDESFQEALFVKKFCEDRSIDVDVRQVNVPLYMEKTGKSGQVAARECRYDFFQEIMEQEKPSYLALGHHGDDQLETILMRLTRGSTGKARAGIPFSRPFSNGEIIRPFLCLTKEEIEDYCEIHSLEPRIDPSNAKDLYSRNRFRMEILPFLKQENPRVHEHFQRFSEELIEDEELLWKWAADQMKNAAAKEAGKITVKINAFQAMPMPLQRRGIQLILNYLYDDKPASLSAVHIEQIFSLLNNPQPSGTLDFPDLLKIERSYGDLIFQVNPSEKKPYSFEVSQPGKIRLPNGGSITVEFTSRPNDYPSLDCFLISADQLKFPLVIRTRQDGDRMTLKGMAGSKKIKDIFIDRKVPIEDRKIWPVVTDGDGNILWLPGLKKSHYSYPDLSSTSHVLLTYKSNDSSGRHTNNEK